MSTSKFQMISWYRLLDPMVVSIVILLLALGMVLSLSTSPTAARSYDLDPYHFAWRHLVFASMAMAIMVVCSAMSAQKVLKWSMILLTVSLGLVLLTLLVGEEINGATRWLDFHYFKLQPSELLKPSFVVATAWLLARSASDQSGNSKPYLIIGGLLLLVVFVLLIWQPDIGTTLLFVAIWLILLMVSTPSSKVPIIILAGGAVAVVSIGILLAAPDFLGLETRRLDQFWTTLGLENSNIANRLDQFVSTLVNGDSRCHQHKPSYQLCTSWSSFKNGGLVGLGLGAGEIKYRLPEAHTDFVFAVIGEELGAVGCLFTVAVFAVLLWRGLARVRHSQSLEVLLASSGLLIMICLQAFVSMASSIGLVPTTGMTLPLISYGGSSMVATGISVGFLLALTRSDLQRQPRVRI